MEKEELLKLWTDKLYERVDTAFGPKEEKLNFEDIVEEIFNAGIETGRDMEKLQVQLSKHSKPFGYETD